MFLKLILLILTAFSGLIEKSPSVPTETVSFPVETTTSLPSTTTTQPEIFVVEKYNAEFLALTNSHRTTPLKWNPSLASYAEQKLYTQVDQPLFHSNISTLLSEWNHAGENLGVGPSVETIQDALVASPTHYANIVDPLFTHYGSATKEGNDGRIWTVHIFGG